VSPSAASFICRCFASGLLKTCFQGQKYILRVMNIRVSRWTVRKIVRQPGLRSYAKVKKPRLLPRHKSARLSFARAFAAAPEHFWKYVIFTDETKFNLYGPDGYKRVWRKPGCQLQDWHVRQVVKFGGGSVMAWGAISYRGVGKLVFIDGKMDARKFIDILSVGYPETLSMHQFAPDEVFLQQDNDPKHNSRSAREWVSGHGIRVIPWPSCSPDMNIIEHVWNYIDTRLRDRPQQPKSIDELKLAILEEWHSIPLEYIHALYDSMFRRIEALLKAKGGYTKY
jgi:hypothetical protein